MVWVNYGKPMCYRLIKLHDYRVHWKTWRLVCLLYLAEEAAGGGVGLCPSVCCLAAAFLILFSLGQRCNVNTNETEPCLLTSPLQDEGEREIKTVCVNPATQPLLLLFWQQRIMYLLVLITWIAHLRSWFIIQSLRLCCFLSCNQEDLIQCTDPDSLQVSTKDMDSTLSKASRAIKKTSKKVKAESFLWVILCFSCGIAPRVTQNDHMWEVLLSRVKVI